MHEVCDLAYALIIDYAIAPQINASLIAFMQYGKKEDKAPDLESAIREFDEWLESGDAQSPEERERAMVWGLSG